MAIQQARSDLGRPMFGRSYGQTACTRCGMRVPFGIMICWFPDRGWTCVPCCQRENLAHFSARGRKTDPDMRRWTKTKGEGN
jgi:hypothetical protein